VEVSISPKKYPHGWNYKIERYFEENQIPNEEKVVEDSICLKEKGF